MITLESIEFDKNHPSANQTLVAAFMSDSFLTKRSRKAARPSKSMKISQRISCMNQLIPTAHYQQSEEASIITVISTDDEQSNRIDEQENNYEDQIDVHPHVITKRPPLSYHKRLQANARERERVHNLTAAFEALRKVIPMYHGQPKLSRLSILRIACSYVLVLGALNEIDFSEGQNAYTLNESFHLLSSTILNELKRKKTTNNRND
jgi:hypothetical protein